MTHTKSTRYIARNDYAAIVDGIEIGFSNTAFGAEIICNDYVSAQIELAARAADGADAAALLEVENQCGVDYWDRLDRAADVAPRIAPTPIWINTTYEAAFAVACITRRKHTRAAA